MTAAKIVAFTSELDQRGYTVIPNALLLDEALTANACRTWAVLAFYARESDEAWPGQERLGERLGLSERHLRRALRDLEDAGWLATQRRGLGKTNLYRLTVPSGLDRTPVADQTGRPRPTSSTQEKKETEEASADPRAAEVHAYYSERRGLNRPLSAGTAKLLARAFNAGFNVLDLHRAVDGLLGSDWHRERGQLGLSVIFKTGPGTEGFEDRIQGFIDRGLSLSNQPSNGHVEVPDWVKRQLRLYGERGHENPQVKGMGEDALAWLERAGLKALWSRPEPPCELTRIVPKDWTP